MNSPVPSPRPKVIAPARLLRALARGALALGLGATAGTLAACGGGGAIGEQLVTAEHGELTETSPLGLAFAAAAAEAGVPVDLLKALAYTSTGLEPALGTSEFDDQAPAFGLFGLRGDELAEAARLAGVSVDALLGDQSVELEAVAKLLARYRDDAGVALADHDDPRAYRPALARFHGNDAELGAGFADDVLRHLARGRAIPLEDGTTLVIRRYAIDVPGADDDFATDMSALGASDAIQRPSPNFSTRSTSIELVVIHTCEGGYSGCVSWLRNPRAQVSAHYVVKEDGSEVSQLVDENRKAWHVSANYRARLNGGVLTRYEGVNVNNLAVGIEHGGFASQRTWSPGLINRSAALVRGIVRRHGIPADRYHVVAHGRLQPESRTDPGPNWPWTSYLQSIAGGTAPSNPPSNPNPPTTPNPPSNPNPPSTPGRAPITVDNATAGRFRASASWESSTWASGKIGADYRFRSPGESSDLAEFKVAIPTAGRYEVFTRVPGNGYNREAPFFIEHAGGRATVRRDLSGAGNSWVSLGTYEFRAGDEWIVAASRWTGARGYLIADAVRLEPR